MNNMDDDSGYLDEVFRCFGLSYRTVFDTAMCDVRLVLPIDGHVYTQYLW